MKRIYLAALAASIAVAAAAPLAWAGVETGPKVAMHVSAATTKASTVCTTWTPVAQGTACSTFLTEAPLGVEGQLIYVVIAQVDTPAILWDGIAGAQFGIDYNGNDGQGVDVVSWTPCADGQQYPNAGPRGEFPESGGGNRVTWANCQTTRIGTEGIHTVVGVFQVYAYSADKLRLTPNRNLDTGSAFALANCSAAESTFADSLSRLGQVGFGTATGCNPCTATICPVPVLPVTWGRIKSLYGP